MQHVTRIMMVMGCSLGFSMATAHADLQLEQVFDEAGVWDITPDQAVERWSTHGFKWMEQNQSNNYRWIMPVRVVIRNEMPLSVPIEEGPRLLMLGEIPIEVVVRFQNNKLLGLMAMFYTRGDSKPMRIKEFQTLAATIEQRLDTWTGAKGIAQQGDGRGGGAVISRKIWTHDRMRVDLESGYTRFAGEPNRPEFIRMRVIEFDSSLRARLLGGNVASAPKTNALHGAAGVMAMKKGVQSRPNGDRIIAVPMVDQGSKGYCVAAVLERVARFYGREFDQHEAAQLANTTAAFGTSSESLIKALRSTAHTLKMVCKGRTDIDETVTEVDQKRMVKYTVPKDFADLLKVYNREAKKAGLPQYDIWDSLYIGLEAVYVQLDKPTLRTARLSQEVRARQFQADIKKYIDAGVPVVWAVIMGFIEEKDLASTSSMSGHMRMIVGYNQQNREFIYTDTWGPGHEEKRMSMDDAWVINRGYFTVAPQGVRL